MTEPIVPVEAAATTAKPFLKWAGGKMQLLSQFETCYPPELRQSKIKQYVEPFLGSGAVFMNIIQNYQVDQIYLSDINAELILVYHVVQQNPAELLEILECLHNKYYSLDETQRATLFYEVRNAFNHQKSNDDPIKANGSDTPKAVKAQRAAYFIFLNKTCFNGLFRVNKKGEFNVPFGGYIKPLICDVENIIAVSKLLERSEIRSIHYSDCEQFVTDHSFIYFDPPYRPLTPTSSFTSYSSTAFGELEQEKLAQFFRRLHNKFDVKLMLSNSDPQNIDPNDDFFPRLYEGFTIRKVYANRMINSNAKRRGKISELLITNY